MKWHAFVIGILGDHIALRKNDFIQMTSATKRTAQAEGSLAKSALASKLILSLPEMFAFFTTLQFPRRQGHIDEP